MKKIISLILVVALLGCLAGCQTKEGLPLSEEKVLEIRQAFIERTKGDYPADDLTLRPVWSEDGIYALYVDGPFGYTMAVRDEVVGGPGHAFLFSFPDGQRLYIYKDNVFYSLKEAYDAGVLKAKHLESLHKDEVYQNVRPPVTQPTEDTQPTESYPLPPYWIPFSSMEEYEALVKAVDLPQDELQKFLDRNDYELNGIKGKEDIIQIRDFLAEFPFPHLEGARMTNFLLSVEGLQVNARYEINDKDSVFYALSIWEDSAEKGFEKYIGEDLSSVEKMEAENYTELYYLGVEIDSFAYCASINGRFLRILVGTSTREEADKIIRETAYRGI